MVRLSAGAEHTGPFSRLRHAYQVRACSRSVCSRLYVDKFIAMPSPACATHTTCVRAALLYATACIFYYYLPFSLLQAFRAAFPRNRLIE